MRLGALHILSNVGIMAALPTLHWQQKGVSILEILANFILAVGASVIGYYVCKWLDSWRKGR